MLDGGQKEYLEQVGVANYLKCQNSIIQIFEERHNTMQKQLLKQS